MEPFYSRLDPLIAFHFIIPRWILSLKQTARIWLKTETFIQRYFSQFERSF